MLTSPGWPTVRETFFSWSVLQVARSRSVLRGFWLDVKMFMIVEVVVLVLGLVIALVRTIALPVLFPLRLLATVCVDVFRGVPTILLVYLVGFGVPALELSGVPDRAPSCSAGSRWRSATRPTSPRSTAPGSVGPPRPARRGAGARPDPTQALRHVILPQAVRRVLPPLLNDFISLQKDVALVSILGPQEAFRVAQIYADANFNYTPLIAAAAAVPVRHDPADADRRPDAGAQPARAGARCAGPRRARWRAPSWSCAA